MARIRTIKPEFFTSQTVGRLTFAARLTFIGLWTYVDDHGRGLDDVRLIRAALWPLDDRSLADMEADLGQLAREGLIYRYEVDGRGYLTVMGWREHQKVSHPTDSKYPPPPQEVTPDGGGGGEGSRIIREDSGTIPEDSRTAPPRARGHAPAEGKGREGKGRELTDTLPNGSGAASAPEAAAQVQVEVEGVARRVRAQQEALHEALTPEALMPLVRQRLRLGRSDRQAEGRDLKHLRELIEESKVPVSAVEEALLGACAMRDDGELRGEGIRPGDVLGVRWLAHVPQVGPSNWERARGYYFGADERERKRRGSTRQVEWTMPVIGVPGHG